MIKIAKAINSFASVAQQVQVAEQPVVSPEESVFVLTSSQLQEIVSRAVLEATEPLYRELALDRQRIAKLEQREPQPLQKDRGEILRALLVANNGKLLAKEARLKMRLPDYAFSKLVKSMESEIGSKPHHLNRSRRILYLK